MDIDMRIQEILSHSFPVNDNGKKTTAQNISPCDSDFFSQPSVYNRGINIVGNRNVVVNTNYSLIFFFIFSYVFWLTRQ